MIVMIKGIVRDRVVHGILMCTVLFFCIPSISTLSMRQVTELSITLSLSLTSFILLVTSTFIGGTSLWKDMERRYTVSVLGLPMSRRRYLLGKFIGISCFIIALSLFFGLITCLVVKYASIVYPPSRAVVWNYLFLSFIFDSLKYILLVGIAFLLSTVSTSFFLPIFGTLAAFLTGSAMQQVYDFIKSPAGQTIPPLVRKTAVILYYLIPNFSAFDYKVNAIYAIPPNPSGIFLTLAYFIVYLGLVLTCATLLFERREIQ